MTKKALLDHCVVCGSTAAAPLFAVERAPMHPFRPPASLDLAAGFGALDIVECTTCGHVFNAGFDPNHVDNLYAAMVLTNTPVSESMISNLEAIADYILANAASEPVIVDVGGGTGALARTLAKRAREVHLVEPSRALRPEDFVGSAVTLHQSLFPAPALGDRVFDVIASRQVIEHIPEPMPFLRAVRSRLAGGIAYLELPSAEYIEQTGSIVDFHYPHVHYYRRSEFETLVRRAGFDVLDVKELKDGHDRAFLLRAAQPQNVAPYRVVFDDTPMYDGHRAYGPDVDIPIARPSAEALDEVAVVVITSYLHDVVINKKVRDLGFRGPVCTVRSDEHAGHGARPPGLFQSPAPLKAV